MTESNAYGATDEPACVAPCPVADGAMGLLCTCGNVVQRWSAISDRLRAEPDLQDELHAQLDDADAAATGEKDRI